MTDFRPAAPNTDDVWTFFDSGILVLALFACFFKLILTLLFFLFASHNKDGERVKRVCQMMLCGQTDHFESELKTFIMIIMEPGQHAFFRLPSSNIDSHNMTCFQ